MIVCLFYEAKKKAATLHAGLEPATSRYLMMNIEVLRAVRVFQTIRLRQLSLFVRDKKEPEGHEHFRAGNNNE